MQLTVDINTKKMTDATGMVALAAVDKPQLFTARGRLSNSLF